ncbi:unnamed protein product [Fusarium graminearum]|nr:unnamed protein product [Fusarium graminearum]
MNTIYKTTTITRKTPTVTKSITVTSTSSAIATSISSVVQTVTDNIVVTRTVDHTKTVTEQTTTTITTDVADPAPSVKRKRSNTSTTCAPTLLSTRRLAPALASLPRQSPVLALLSFPTLCASRSRAPPRFARLLAPPGSLRQ